MVVLTIKFFLQKRIGFFLYITYKIRLNEIVHVNSIKSSNKEGNEMKKQNVKLTPEALLLTALKSSYILYTDQWFVYGGELWHEKKCDCGFTGK